MIIYTRKIDKYKLNILYKKENEWIKFSEKEIKFELERYFIISDLKFIKPNKNNIENINNLFLFVKGIASDINGIRMFMKIITIDLNSLNNINNTNNSNINNNTNFNNSKIFTNSTDILNSFLELYYFEAKDFNLYDSFITGNFRSPSIDVLQRSLVKINIFFHI